MGGWVARGSGQVRWSGGEPSDVVGQLFGEEVFEFAGPRPGRVPGSPGLESGRGPTVRMGTQQAFVGSLPQVPRSIWSIV